ncbi:MAG TPA: glutathione-disulfide reductase [Hyphomicrobium sp.]|nr:glutathione-disulfide reductase [Hyphomicrobium sp.]
MSQGYDLFVIGAGSGGVRAARIAAGHGARVAIAEDDRFGGTCVIRGCVPKKLLVYASRFRDDFEDSAGFGWNPGKPEFDWPSLIAAKDIEIARLEQIYRGVLDSNGVEVFAERAVVEGANTVRLLRSGRTLMAGKILIAAGGRPFIDKSLKGVEHVITSDEAFHLDKLPASVVVAGGGYIAVEFASIFAGLGSKVTLVYRGPKILRGFDEDLRDGLTGIFLKRGIDIVTNATISRVELAGGGRRATLSNGGVLEASQVMMATGRAPNTKGLGLENVGVVLQPSGAVVVDGEAASSVPSIYAVGDVTDRVNLTPVAIREGHAFADRAFGPKDWDVHYENIPTGVFTTPEIGTVGLPEAQARIKFNAVDIYKTSFRPMRNILAGREQHTLMKLVVDAKSQRVVGLHVLGPDAAEIVQMAAIAMNMGATKADFDRTMALHPSASEELVTLRDKWAPAEAAAVPLPPRV